MNFSRRPVKHPMRALAWRIGGILAACASTADAAGLGNAEIRSWLGEPVSLRIPLISATDEALDAGCFAVVNPNDRTQIDRQYQLTLVEGRKNSYLLVQGKSANSEPVIQLSIRAGCSDTATTVRDYALILDLPPAQAAPAAEVPPAAHAGAATAAARAPASLTGGAPTTPSAKSNGDAPATTSLPNGSPVVASDGRWTVYAGDSLSRIAAGIYPGNRAHQAQYIAALRALNTSVAGAPDDAMLTLGSQLVLPDLKALSAVVARTAAMAPQPANASRDTTAAPPAQKAPDKPAPPTAPKPVAKPVETPAKAVTPAASKPASVTPAEPAPRASTVKEKAPAAGAKPAPQAPKAPATVVAPSVATVTPPLAADKKKPAQDGFHLRLSGAEMDLSRMRGVTEKTRNELREKQLLLDADDQVAALLALKNTVRQLESRLNEMQLKMSAAPTAMREKTAEKTATQTAAAEAPKADPVASPVTGPVTRPAAAPGASAAQPQPATFTSGANDAAPGAVAPDVAGAAKAAQEQSKPVPASATPDRASAATSESTSSPPVAGKPAAVDIPAPGLADMAAEKLKSIPFDSLADNPQYLPWAGGAVALLIAFGLMARRLTRRSEVFDGPLPHDALSRVTRKPAGRADEFAEWADETPSDVLPTAVPEANIAPPSADETRAARGMASDTDEASINEAPAPALEPSVPAEPIPFEMPEFDPPLASASTPVDFMSTMRLDSSPLAEESSDRFVLDNTPSTTVDFLVGMDDKPTEDRIRRLQYMYESYPELAANTISIDDADSMINAARLYYEEGATERATELLNFGLEERPQETRYWLAQFEIYRLERRVAEFAALAAKFNVLFGHTDDWPKVRHVGHELDPANPLYAAAGRATLADERFDPLAENWLNAPVDAQAHELAQDLRQALFTEFRVKPGDIDSTAGRLSAGQ